MRTEPVRRKSSRSGLNLLGLTVALSVSEDISLWNIHFASDFAEANAGGVRGVDLLPGFVSDLSTHTFWITY